MARKEARTYHTGAQASSARRSTFRRTIYQLRSLPSGHRSTHQCIASRKTSEKLATPTTRSLGFIQPCTIAHIFRTRFCIIMYISTQGTDYMRRRISFMLEGYLEENLRDRSRTQIANKMSLQSSDHKRVVVAGSIMILAPRLGLCGIFLILAIAVDV